MERARYRWLGQCSQLKRRARDRLHWSMSLDPIELRPLCSGKRTTSGLSGRTPPNSVRLMVFPEEEPNSAQNSLTNQTCPRRGTQLPPRFIAKNRLDSQFNPSLLTK